MIHHIVNHIIRRTCYSNLPRMSKSQQQQNNLTTRCIQRLAQKINTFVLWLNMYLMVFALHPVHTELFIKFKQWNC
jgi:hypothetical protein